MKVPGKAIFDEDQVARELVNRRLHLPISPGVRYIELLNDR